MDGLCQPVRGDDAQPGAGVGEEQEVNDLRGHGEVAQDEVECAVRGGVGGLAGVEGEDVVGPSPLELPLRHEQEGAGIGAGEGPLLPVAEHAVSPEHLRDALGRGAREQVHVQLAQGYGPAVVQFGGARHLGAEPDVRIPPVHRRRSAAEDGPVGVDMEQLDGCREGLDEAAFHVVGARGLAIGPVQRGPQVLQGILFDLGPGPLRDPGLRTAWKPGRSTGRLSYSSRQKARTANITLSASVRSVWVLGTGTFQKPDRPGASNSMAPRTAFHRSAMSPAWWHQKSLMARLRSAARRARKWRMSSLRVAACFSSSSCSWLGGIRAMHPAAPP